MKILLDTHVLLWLLSDDEMISAEVKNLINDEKNQIFFSPISILEVEIKLSAHPDKMTVGGEDVVNFCNESEFICLPIKISHILAVKNLKRPENVPPHKDPFDRLMLAQAIAENMIFMTHDKRIAEYSSQNIYKV